MNFKLVLCGVSAALCAYACSGSESEEEPQIVEEKVSISVSSSQLSIPAGTKSELTLTVSPADRIADVELSVADEEVASISDTTHSAGGVITVALESNALGTTTLAAVCEDALAQCGISVDPIAVESITLDAETKEIFTYDSFTLGVTISPENATNPLVEWSSSNEEVAYVNRGVVTGVSAGTADIVASVGGLTALCTVTVKNIEAESLTLDVTEKELAIGETFIVTATILPDSVTVKAFNWKLSADGIVSYTIIDAVEGDNVIAARVAGVAAGDVVLSVTSAALTAECKIKVNSPVEPDPEDPGTTVADPKVGDYYYSDGTWSDGGLVSIESDGTNPVWADEKPSPVAGKTVIGIVFSTDQSRISTAEKNAGYTHGLVVSTKGAHAPGAKETRYCMSFDEDVAYLGQKKLGSSWYADINGYSNTNTIVTNAGNNIASWPAFDWTVTDFSPSAPVATSGWYVPGIGQVWDILANLGGNELAAYLKTMRTYSSDVTRSDGITLTYDVAAQLNSVMAKVPDSQKEDFVYTTPRMGVNYSELMSSSLYDNTDGNVCLFWIASDGFFQPMTEWTDTECLCRPVLSF